MTQDQAYPRPRRGRSLLMLRGIMVVLSLAIATYLILRGDEAIGLLVGALALVRVAFLLSLARRRSSRGAYPMGRRSSRASPPADVREVLFGLRRSELQVAAGVMGMDLAHVRGAFRQGHSLAQLAVTAGVPVERLVNAVVSDATARIDSDVAGGRLSQERAVAAKARLPMWANRLVNFQQGDRPRGRGARQAGGGWDGPAGG